jgi:hypothetical protein
MSSGGAEQQSEGCERGQLQLVHCMRVSTVVDAATSLGRAGSTQSLDPAEAELALQGIFTL